MASCLGSSVVEQWTENPRVVSSILTRGTRLKIFAFNRMMCRKGSVAQRLEQATHNRLVAGSIPAGPTQ